MTIEKHPMRYPKHNGDKGQLVGGECNTTRCHDHGANWFNNQTYGYYCFHCARGINGFDKHPICERVDHQLTRAEQDKIHNAHLDRRYGKDRFVA